MLKNMGSIFGVFLLCLFCFSCDENSPPPSTGDGAIVDGTTVTGDGTTVTGDGTIDSSGWIVDDSGTVIIIDGGVTITDDSGVPFVCYPTICAGKILECGDCQDNDNDGKVDWKDPECLGPCDNTEGAALIGGIGGGGGNTCQVDCYFDYGNGSGNDDCWWDHRCDILEPEVTLCPYDATMLGTKNCPATQSSACTQFCLPFTPNGCDCFGCCTFPQLAGKGTNGTDLYIWIGAMDSKNIGTCTLADVTDHIKCPLCTPISNCLNECGRCEVCIGKPLPPPDCYQTPDAGVTVGDGGTVTDGGIPTDAGTATDSGGTIPPTAQCPNGEQPCGLPGQATCPTYYYCISGCCQHTIL